MITVVPRVVEEFAKNLLNLGEVEAQMATPRHARRGIEEVADLVDRVLEEPIDARQSLRTV